MAVTKVTENWKSRTVDENETSLTPVREFDVDFDNADSPISRPLLARTATDGTTTVPGMWSLHPYNSWLYVKSVHVEPGEGPFAYHVTVTYGSVTDPYSSTGHEPVHPLLEPPEISYSFVTVTEPVDIDITGAPITNSAGELFDPPITREFHDLVLRIVRNEAGFNALLAAEYKGAVNSDVWYGFAAETIRCVVFDGVQRRVAGLIYWRVTYELHIRWDGWRKRVMDAGYIELNVAGDDYQKIKIEDPDTKIKEAVTSPWPLDGAGRALTPAQKKAGTAYWKLWPLYPLKPFSVLGL